IPEKEHVLEDLRISNTYLYAEYLENATSKLYRTDLDGGNSQSVELPGPGTLMMSGLRKSDPFLFFQFTSFTSPGSIYAYDLKTGESKTFFETPLNGFDAEQYVSKQVFYTSKDGTKVPMFIVHKKGLKMEGNNPTYLYAYGGFNVNLTPSFSTSRLLLLENGGIFAMPNLRGGGEYGEKWHRAGMLFDKQNVFDDFIGAAEYLIKENYTSPSKLAIAGGSNGGLLVGAVMNQRPELFRVAFPAVGVMDMLRYHKFTVGWGWVPEYGSSEESKEMFTYLKGYSPLHNIDSDLPYPATMVTTADHDDRVVPAHSFKYIATLQEKYKGKNPVLIRIETNAGHGAGKPTEKILEEQADKWAFMFYNMGINL
ncbi:prolyl oligopeptidase family serine peptidase, partial [bacterium]|nr:prolyl oligopeptidase family serine peptidase [bacterium]